MDYLFRYVEANCKKTEKARVISFLTGYSEKKITQAFSRLEKEKLELKEKSEFGEKFFNDIEVVRKYFKILKLEKIEEQMDLDLEINFD